jgi:hypothetical protein
MVQRINQRGTTKDIVAIHVRARIKQGFGDLKMLALDSVMEWRALMDVDSVQRLCVSLSLCDVLAGDFFESVLASNM